MSLKQLYCAFGQESHSVSHFLMLIFGNVFCYDFDSEYPTTNKCIKRGVL